MPRGTKTVKTVKVNSLSLAKAAAQFLAKIEYDLQPLLQDKILGESIQKIDLAISKLEAISNKPEKINTEELSSEFQKTDKALEKMKDKVNDLQSALEKIEKVLQEKLVSKLEALRKTDPKDATDADNRNKVETHMKLMKNMIESAKRKLQEVQAPTEAALKRMHAIKPKLYALSIPDTFERCQKRAERLNEEITELCHATAEMSISDVVVAGTALLFKDAAPVKLFLPKLQSELEKSSKLLHQSNLHLRRIFPLNAENASAASAAATDAEKNAGAGATPAAASVPVDATATNTASAANAGSFHDKDDSKTNRFAA